MWMCVCKWRQRNYPEKMIGKRRRRERESGKMEQGEGVNGI